MSSFWHFLTFQLQFSGGPKNTVGVLIHGGGQSRQEKGQSSCFSFFSSFKSINAIYLINKAFYQTYSYVRTLTGPKSNFLPNGIGLYKSGFKWPRNRRTNKHFHIYKSRDLVRIKEKAGSYKRERQLIRGGLLWDYCKMPQNTYFKWEVLLHCALFEASKSYTYWISDLFIITGALSDHVKL